MQQKSAFSRFHFWHSWKRIQIVQPSVICCWNWSYLSLASQCLTWAPQGLRYCESPHSPKFHGIIIQMYEKLCPDHFLDLPQYWIHIQKLKKYWIFKKFLFLKNTEFFNLLNTHNYNMELMSPVRPRTNTIVGIMGRSSYAWHSSFFQSTDDHGWPPPFFFAWSQKNSNYYV